MIIKLLLVLSFVSLNSIVYAGSLREDLDRDVQEFVKQKALELERNPVYTEITVNGKTIKIQEKQTIWVIGK